MKKILISVLAFSAVSAFANQNTTSTTGGLVRDHETTIANCGVGNYLFRGITTCTTATTTTAKAMTAPTTTTTPAATTAATSAATTPDWKKELLFGTGKRNLTKEHQAMIADAIEFVKANPETRIEIQGFADATGSLTTNQALAKARAMAVKKQLITAGIAESKIETVKPADAVSTTENSLADRKVELRIYK